MRRESQLITSGQGCRLRMFTYVLFNNVRAGEQETTELQDGPDDRFFFSADGVNRRVQPVDPITCFSYADHLFRLWKCHEP